LCPPDGGPQAPAHSCPRRSSRSRRLGPEQLNAEQRRYLLEIVEDRYDTRSILITSQLPIGRWYEVIGDPTLADAILDRIIHNA
jgi:DNA replication protein DnaC